MSAQVPHSYLCPISFEMMDDPYIDPDGNSYERFAIEEWLRRSVVSPITRNPLKVDQLVPNRGLKDMIDDYKRSNGLLAPEILPPSALGRKPINFFAIIDNSGSMGEPCGTQEREEEEDDGFSRLDLVKHTLNTVIAALHPEDKICLIKFSTTAEVICPLTPLTERNKRILREKLKYLDPEYQTNIWDGVRTALDIVAALPAEECDVEIFLLTDGVPNINPPRPIVETVQNYVSKKCAHHKPKLHTFGYGYNLVSSMLYDLAKSQDGFFGFIPDSSMVGTVFINALSSTLVRADPDLRSPLVDAWCEKFCLLLTDLLTAEEPSAEALAAFVVQVGEKVKELKAEGSANVRGLEFLQNLLLDCKESSDPNLGQVAKSIRPNFFKKWGKHYLYSVLSAFEHQVCINFKDKAMQSFKSPAFLIEQERVEDLFLQLTPPKPSLHEALRRNRGYGGPAPMAHTPAPAATMGAYHNQGGGCFSGDSLVLSAGNGGSGELGTAGAPVRVDCLCKGQFVWTREGASEVECVVRLRYTGPLFTVGEMQLTPYHPVQFAYEGGCECRRNLSAFPLEISYKERLFDGYVYDLVLRNRSIVAAPLRWEETVGVAGLEDVMYAATFGHTAGRGASIETEAGKETEQEQRVFSHAYFGSERIVRDLQAHPQYASGLVTLSGYCYLREGDGEVGEAAEGRICGLTYPGYNGPTATADVSIVYATPLCA